MIRRAPRARVLDAHPHMSAPHVVIDTKNLALFGRGISAFVTPLIRGWLANCPATRFSFVGPPFDSQVFMEFGNWRHHVVPWPARLPRPLRHPVYDNVLFPYAVSRLKPDFLFSPYHDVRLPPKRRVRSVIIVHDTCIDDLPDVYPVAYRTYYVATLRRNLKRATHVLTDSEASRRRILDRYGVPPERVSVVYNPVDPTFIGAETDHRLVQSLRERFADARLLFYPGGCEYRKNIGRLAEAVALFSAAGENWRLLVTGDAAPIWAQALARLDAETRGRIHFLGYLEVPQLRACYAAADLVVYPTLCEGFGRVCLDAMILGVPLACSDLPVLREIAGDYPVYFDPLNPRAIADSMCAAMAVARPQPYWDRRFNLDTVVAQFTGLMDQLFIGNPARA
jgi:glycosyltransferase involved in cell wall biosynthesis